MSAISADRTEADQAFEQVMAAILPRLRRSLVVAEGHHRGGEAVSAALLYAWTHRDKIACLDDPVPYLFKVGRSRLRDRRLRPPPSSPADHSELPHIEPGLERALLALSVKQRTAVVLVTGWQWSYGEVAELLGISKGSVQRHVDRGLAKLRRELGS